MAFSSLEVITLQQCMQDGYTVHSRGQRTTFVEIEFPFRFKGSRSGPSPAEPSCQSEVGSFCVPQADFERLFFFSSGSRVLGLQACTITPAVGGFIKPH